MGEISALEQRAIMDRWISGATYVGVPEGGVEPGADLPEVADDEE